jgi:hypothetical protein
VIPTSLLLVPTSQRMVVGMSMDVNQLLIAIIGAISTLLAAVVGSRSRPKTSTTPGKRSTRNRFFMFGFYFLLGGVVTYLILDRLPLFGQVDNQLDVAETKRADFRKPIVAFTQGKDPDASPLVPVGSVILSAIPPDKFEMLPSNAGRWAPADGRLVDSTSLYAMLTGTTLVPDLRGMSLTKGPTLSSASDSAGTDGHYLINLQAHRASSLHWYVRIN